LRKKQQLAEPIVHRLPQSPLAIEKLGDRDDEYHVVRQLKGFVEEGGELRERRVGEHPH
jgi:hypothetical protein